MYIAKVPDECCNNNPQHWHPWGQRLKEIIHLPLPLAIQRPPLLRVRPHKTTPVWRRPWILVPCRPVTWNHHKHHLLDEH